MPRLPGSCVDWSLELLRLISRVKKMRGIESVQVAAADREGSWVELWKVL